jgi:hypothetical protein
MATDSKSSIPKPTAEAPKPVQPVEIDQAKEGEFYVSCVAKVTVKVITDSLDRVPPLIKWIDLVIRGAKKPDRLEFAQSIATAGCRVIDDPLLRSRVLKDAEVAEYVNSAKRAGARASIVYFGDIDTEGVHKPSFDVCVTVDQIVPLAVL